MLDTMNTGAQPSVTLFEFVGVHMSVFLTVAALVDRSIVTVNPL
jgi:hypothetical protein